MWHDVLCAQMWMLAFGLSWFAGWIFGLSPGEVYCRLKTKTLIICSTLSTKERSSKKCSVYCSAFQCSSSEDCCWTAWLDLCIVKVLESCHSGIFVLVCHWYCKGFGVPLPTTSFNNSKEVRAVPDFILRGGHIFFQTPQPPGHAWSQSSPTPRTRKCLINPPYYGSNMPWPPGQVTHPPLRHVVNKHPPSTGQKSACGPPQDNFWNSPYEAKLFDNSKHVVANK